MLKNTLRLIPIGLIIGAAVVVNGCDSGNRQSEFDKKFQKEQDIFHKKVSEFGKHWKETYKSMGGKEKPMKSNDTS